MSAEQKAVKKYGTSEFSRWLLSSGNFLAVADYEDHRIIGEFCKDSWTQFIAEGACSLHYDSQCGHLWIRTSGLGCAQMSAFQDAIDNGYITKLRTLRVDIYDGDNFSESLDIDSELAKLFLTDQIAYQIERTNFEDEYN